MIALDHAPYTPFDDPRTVGPPGLSPMALADWTVVHADFAAQMAYRQRLLVEHPATVMAFDPSARGAVDELLDAILAHLSTRTDYTVDGQTVMRPDGVPVIVDRESPLATLGLLVAEDLCVMLPDADVGEYRLMAAVLCFPSRWLLAEKFRRPLTDIHAPVPHYDQTLARRVNRVFETLRPDRPLVRCNWLVHGDPELFRPMGRDDPGHDRTEPADTELYLRTERQGMVRLPHSGAAVFSIKTSVTPFSALDHDQAVALRSALMDLASETLDYSERGDAYDAALTQLDAQIAAMGATGNRLHPGSRGGKVTN